MLSKNVGSKLLKRPINKFNGTSVMLFRFIFICSILLPYFSYSGIWNQCKQQFVKTSDSFDPITQLKNNERSFRKNAEKRKRIRSDIQKLLAELEQTTDEAEIIKKRKAVEMKLEDLQQVWTEEEILLQENTRIHTQWQRQLMDTTNKVRGITEQLRSILHDANEH